MKDTLWPEQNLFWKESFASVIKGGAVASVLPLLTLSPGELPAKKVESPYVVQAQEGASHVAQIDYISRWDENKSQPRTPLGKRLWAIRERAIANGMSLLSEDEILKEIEFRRGEVNHG